MQLIEPPHQRQSGGADGSRQVVHRPSAEAQQGGLARYRQAMLTVDHSFAPSPPALLSARAKKSSSSACCPILACSGARSTGSGPCAVPNTSAVCKQLPLPLRELVGVNLKLCGQLGQRLVLAQRRQRYAGLKLRSVLAAGAPP